MSTQRVDDNTGAVLADNTGIQTIINFTDGTSKVFDFADWAGTRPGWLDGHAAGKQIGAILIRDLAVQLPTRTRRSLPAVGGA